MYLDRCIMMFKIWNAFVQIVLRLKGTIATNIAIIQKMKKNSKS